MAVKAGDMVRIVTREVAPEDMKSGLYYAYFGGITGKVDRVYADGSVCVDADLESLNEETRSRHLAMQEAERKRWLDALSDEVRNRLTGEQKQLQMSYRILISDKDAEITKGGKPASHAADPKAVPAQAEGGRKGAERPPSAAAGAQPKPKAAKEEDEPRRLSEAELAAKEEEYLRSKQSGS